MMAPMMALFAGISAVFLLYGDKNQTLQLASSGLVLILALALMFFGYFQSRKSRVEMMSLETAGELIQLRQWTKAEELLRSLLSSPMRNPQSRLQALAFLIHVLNRCQRYSDALDVYDHLLGQQRIDDSSIYNLRAGRAMALLRDDRLYDADKAIGQLRQTGAEDAPPLIMLQLYHALKTGRLDDLVEIYARRVGHLKTEMGPKAADAHAFAAAAYFQLGDAERAERCWTLATLIAPPVEWVRRFTELNRVAGGCRPAVFPMEVAS